MVTLILTLTMCALLILMIWSVTYFYPLDRPAAVFPKGHRRKSQAA
jgi:hypothetical protein